MVLTVSSSGARDKKKGGNFKLTELPVDQPLATAFAAFTDLCPRVTETEISASLCAIGAGKDFDSFFDNFG